MAKLADVAYDMLQATHRGGQVTRTLARGLELSLTAGDGYHYLVLSRPVTEPGEMEISICRQAFGVPEDAERFDHNGQVGLRWPMMPTP